MTKPKINTIHSKYRNKIVSLLALCFGVIFLNSCVKKHQCTCQYPDGSPYNIIESSNGDCSEWNEPNQGITCKVM